MLLILFFSFFLAWQMDAMNRLAMTLLRHNCTKVYTPSWDSSLVRSSIKHKKKIKRQKTWKKKKKKIDTWKSAPFPSPLASFYLPPPPPVRVCVRLDGTISSSSHPSFLFENKKELEGFFIFRRLTTLTTSLPPVTTHTTKWKFSSI